MNKHTKQHRKCDGSAIITVMIITMIVVLAGVSMMSMASQQAHSARLVRDDIKAQALAEAGANEAYAILKADFSAVQDAGNFPEKEYGEGTYDATVTLIADDMATIQCVAKVGDAVSTVKMDIKDFGEDDGGAAGAEPPPVGGYAYAIIAGSIRWGGNGPTDVTGGKVQCNGPYDMNGTTDVTLDLLSSVGQVRSVGNCTINGDAEASSFAKKSPGNITGTASTEAVDAVSLPVLDLAPYYQYAASKGEVYNGNYSASAGATIEPNGGVMWVNGDVHISGNSTIIGCIIATGDIKVTGNTTQTQVGDLPALVSRDGDIDLNSGGSSEGLLYAPVGSINMHGGGTHTGTIMCGGEFWKNGAWTAIVFEDSTPPDDPDGGGAAWADDDCMICITAWHE